MKYKEQLEVIKKTIKYPENPDKKYEIYYDFYAWKGDYLWEIHLYDTFYVGKVLKKVGINERGRPIWEKIAYYSWNPNMKLVVKKVKEEI